MPTGASCVGIVLFIRRTFKDEVRDEPFRELLAVADAERLQVALRSLLQRRSGPARGSGAAASSATVPPRSLPRYTAPTILCVDAEWNRGGIGNTESNGT